MSQLSLSPSSLASIILALFWLNTLKIHLKTIHWTPHASCWGITHHVYVSVCLCFLIPQTLYFLLFISYISLFWIVFLSKVFNLCGTCFFSFFCVALCMHKHWQKCSFKCSRIVSGTALLLRWKTNPSHRYLLSSSPALSPPSHMCVQLAL